MMWCRTALLSISSSLYFPAHLSPQSLPYFILGAKNRRKKGERERERVLIRKQNGKENGGETV